MSARQTVDGKCVNTMVLIKPMRLVSGMARRFDPVAMMEVTKKRVPRRPAVRWKWVVKYEDIQETLTRPDAKASTAKRLESLRTVVRDSDVMCGSEKADVRSGATGFTAVSCAGGTGL